MIMSETDKIKRLKELWDKYEFNNFATANSQRETFIDKYPKDKIEDLNLDEYTNIKTNENTSYFTNWIERKTESCGKFRTASSFSYGVYKVNSNNIKDKDEKEHSKDKYRTLEQKNSKTHNSYEDKYVDKGAAENYFGEKVKPLLLTLINFEDRDTVKPFDINYARKVAYLYNPEKLIPIYKKEVLQSIASFFDVENPNFSSYKVTVNIFKKVCECFEIEKSNMDFKTTQKLSSFLRKYFGKSVSFNSKNIIYYGAPGTGKTYTVQNAVKQQVVLSGDKLEDVALFTQFHPSFSYEDFIEGLKPSIENGATELKLTNGIFKKFCQKAMDNLKQHRKEPKKNKLKIYYFVADEINRAELSSVFGELLVCLEESKRGDFDKKGNITDESMLIETQYSYLIDNEKDAVLTQNGVYKFGVPSNLYFIGTMNDIDRSIDTFDLALRRRFSWERMDCDYDVIVQNLDVDNWECYITICKDLNKFISHKLQLGSSFEIGHSYFMEVKTYKSTISQNAVQNLFDKKLKPLIEEYLRGSYSQVEIEKHLKDANKIFTLPSNSKK